MILTRFLPSTRRLAVLAVALMLLSLALASVRFPATNVNAEEPAHDAFNRTWQRTDEPVATHAADRTWMWGPEAFTGPRYEQYAESPDGERLVQYYDKSRMEITNPDIPDDGLWYVSNGLLVVELVTGRMQMGDASFVDLAPAQIPVAGDPTDTSSPTYATFAGLMHAPAYGDGELITLRVDRNGEIVPDAALGSYGATAAHHVVLDGLDHQIASPFWAFMNAEGLVMQDGQLVTDALFENAFYPTGYPIAEAFWATVSLAGVPTDVLIQCFERRCLTWTPGNPDGWQVEAGNVGRHYEQWRYVDNAGTPTPTATVSAETSTPAPETPASTATSTATMTATATRTATPTRTPTEEPTEEPDDDDPTPTPINGETSESGNARKVPWSAHWFPFQNSASLNLYDDNGPLEKYDQYVDATRGYNPGAQDWERSNHSGGLGWWGHCHAWAAASVLESEPHAVTKEGIQFRQDDVEGLLIETYFSPSYRMFGLECQSCEENSPAFRDVTPAEFDRVMREEMGEDRKNVVLDLDPGTPVWNYPAYAYQRDSVIENGVEKVTMKVTISVPRTNITGNDPDSVTYTYTLRNGTEGQWTGGSVADHPDFLWVIGGRTKSGGSQVNPNVDYSIVKEISR